MFVIAYVSQRVADALKSDAELLSAFLIEREPTAASVQPGQVAVEQLRRAVALGRRLKLAELPDELRLVRRRWLVDDDLHDLITAEALRFRLSVSEFVARVVQPSHAFETVDIGQQFHLPRWVIEVIREEQRTRKWEIWPWRVSGVVGAEAKRAHRLWAFKNHPDHGGEHETFVRGQADWDKMKKG